MVEKNVENRKCERVDNVEERTLLVVTVLRSKGTKEDVCRLVELYYEKDREGNYHLLFDKDPRKEKEQI